MRQRSSRWFLLIVVALLGILVMATACTLPTPKPTPEPTPIAGDTALPPTSEPTLTPQARVTALPLPPPQVLFRSPAPGEAQPLEAPIELTFDQPMDQASVEGAFRITPSVDGTFTWSGNRKVSFSPAEDLERGTYYQVVVEGTALNVEGTALDQAVSFEFSTAGYLSVSQVMPAPNSEELAADMAVTVVFDRPVVPLTAINRQDELPQPLSFVPPVRGQGEWLNSSMYHFRPDEGFLPSTRYKARVAAGLTDTTAGVLVEDYTWEFTTVRPAVLDVWPQDRFQYVGPTEVISVTFNQPMDHLSTTAHFSLAPAEMSGDEGIQGTFHWRGGEKPADPETMVFVPSEPLPRGTVFAATMNEGALGKVGGEGTAEATGWRFTTVTEPGIVRTAPEDGEKGVDPAASIQLQFASPMLSEALLDYLTVEPQVTKVTTYWSEFDTKVELYFEQEPATRYRLLLDAGMPDKYGAELEAATSIRYTTGDLAPYALLNTSAQLGTYSTYTDTVIYASYRNVSRLDLGLYRLDLETFMQLNSNWEAWESFAPSEEGAVRHWARETKAQPNEVGMARFELVSGGGDPLPPGLYYLELSAPEMEAVGDNYRPSRHMFVRSPLNLVLKQTRKEALLWASDLASGQPVAGLPLSLYAGKARIDPAGTTDTDGTLLVDNLPVNNLWDPLFAVTGKPGDENFGIAYNAWDQGIGPWNFGVESEFWGSDYQGYLYTDRPIYRPGQTVHFKGILRADDDAHYSLPSQIKAVEVQVSDPQGKQLYKAKLPVSDMGTLYDDLLLAQEAPLGTYFMEIQEPARDLFVSTSFQVAEYRQPEFQVAVSTDGDAYLGGERIATTSDATYYFGGPVADASVHWSVLSRDYAFRYSCPQGQDCPAYSWTDTDWEEREQGPAYGSYGRLIAEGDAQTNDQGRVLFRVPADISSETGSQIFTIEASVTDVNGQEVSNRTEAIVHKGQFYAGVAPRDYLAEVGEEKQVDLLTVDWEGKPVPGVPLTVVFLEHRWYSVREKSEDGNYYWTWLAEDSPVMTATVTTGSNGQATTAFTPEKAGSYRVRTIGRDELGNRVRSSTFLWVWGGDEYVSWRRESNNRLELIADKEEYQVGDVAEILVASPYTGTAYALVTVERGHVVEREVRTLESNSEVLRLPITEDHVPNIFVSVLIVQGSEQAPDGLATFKLGIVKLPVSVVSKELAVTLTPDLDMAAGERYKPRQAAAYDVLVTDADGEPVEAELSLRLADLAVLALADEQGPTLLEHFWRSRGLGVRTSTPLVVSMERFNRELAPGAKGGGGGDGGGLVRSRFADTAFWDPAVRTGKDGRAQVTVQLPDNLTTWRMQARGITADTRVGQAEVDVVSSLDLLVRPVLPRFFVVGDEAQIAAIVHNNTGEPLEVEVNASFDGLALRQEAGQSLAAQAAQVVKVQPGDQAKVVWPVEALPGQEAKVRMWASAGSLYDGREDTLPVYHPSTPEVVATAGDLPEAGLRQEVIQLPAVFDATQGELSLQLNGSLAAATQDALDYLEHYPHECVEQTVSRFLPNVVTWAAMEELETEDQELRQKLAQMVGTGLQRLYAQQHYDGGWGWWVADNSDPYLTAYVLQGMLEAYRTGFVVDADVMARAASYLRGQRLSVSRLETTPEANRLAYVLYVLAEYGIQFEEGTPGELGLAVRLFEKRELLSQYGRATLAAALGLLEPEEPGRVRTLLGDLAGAAVLSATGAHWEEAEPDHWNMNTDIRTTAIVLWSISRLSPDHELLPSIVRWLMAVRQEGHWETTQDTSWSLLGLVAYMQASGEAEASYNYTVYLNGGELARGEMSKDNIEESVKLQVEIADLLADEANRLVIERHPAQGEQTGEGQLYYSAGLRYYLPANQLQAMDRGIPIARQYTLFETGAVPPMAPQYVDIARVGDVVRVKLTIIAPTDLYYVVVEDPLPAGFEGVDLSLKTASIVGQPPELYNLSAAEEDRWNQWQGWDWWWFSHSEMRDEKVVLFAQYLPRGTYEYTYLMRAAVPGEYFVTPSTAYEMYFPEVFGRSDGGKFTIEPSE